MLARSGDWLLILTAAGAARVYAPLEGGGDPDPDPPEGVTFADNETPWWSSTEHSFNEGAP